MPCYVTAVCCVLPPAGNSWDLSSAVMDRALMHADGVYKFPAQRVRGHMCRTNIASNTAFRGFGGPQVRAQLKHRLHS